MTTITPLGIELREREQRMQATAKTASLMALLDRADSRLASLRRRLRAERMVFAVTSIGLALALALK